MGSPDRSRRFLAIDVPRRGIVPWKMRRRRAATARSVGAIASAHHFDRGDKGAFAVGPSPNAQRRSTSPAPLCGVDASTKRCMRAFRGAGPQRESHGRQNRAGRARDRGARAHVLEMEAPESHNLSSRHVASVSSPRSRRGPRRASPVERSPRPSHHETPIPHAWRDRPAWRASHRKYIRFLPDGHESSRSPSAAMEKRIRPDAMQREARL